MKAGRRVLSVMLVCAVGLAIPGLCGARGDDPPVYCVVRLSDHLDRESYAVMDPADLAALTRTIEAEERHFDRALAAAKQQWNSDDLTRDRPFRTSAVKPRRARVVRRYTDPTEASDRVCLLNERQLKKTRAEAAALRKLWRIQKLTPAQKKAEKEKLQQEDARRGLMVKTFETELSGLMAAAPETERAAGPAEAKK